MLNDWMSISVEKLFLHPHLPFSLTSLSTWFRRIWGCKRLNISSNYSKTSKWQSWLMKNVKMSVYWLMDSPGINSWVLFIPSFAIMLRKNYRKLQQEIVLSFYRFILNLTIDIKQILNATMKDNSQKLFSNNYSGWNLLLIHLKLANLTGFSEYIHSLHLV